MNRKTIKVAGWALCLSMAVAGFGIALGSVSNEPTETKAAEYPYKQYMIAWGDNGYGYVDEFTNFTTTSGEVSPREGKTISFSSAQNNGVYAPEYNSGAKALRLYYATNGNGNSVTFDFSQLGHPVTEFYIRGLETTGGIPTINYSIDGGAASNGTATSASSYQWYFRKSGISATTSLTLKNTHTSNVHFNILYMEFTYLGPTVTSVEANVKDGTYYAKTALTASDFDVEVTWSDSSVTHPEWGYDWSVNDGDYETKLVLGDNTISVTYEGVPADSFVLVAIGAHTDDIMMIPSLSITIDESQLIGHVLDPEISVDPIVWESSDTDVATVDENGFVTGVSVGVATITGTSNGHSASCEVTVSQGVLKHNGLYALVADYEYTDWESVTHQIKKEFTSIYSYNGMTTDYSFMPACRKLLKAQKAATGDAADYFLSYDDGGVQQYLVCGSTNERIQTTTYADAFYSAMVWKVSFDVGGCAILQNKSYTDRTIQYDRYGEYFVVSSYSYDPIELRAYDGTGMAGEFTEKYMHVEVSPEDGGTGLCKTDGWYDEAEEAFNDLPEEARNAFVSEPAFSDYADRLESWASANGKRFGTDGSGNENMLIAKANSIQFAETAALNDSKLPIIITLASIGAIATAGSAILIARRRRNEN